MKEPDGLNISALERPATLSDRVTEKVMEMLAASELKPGDRLPSERDLGERFGVSRTVVREAIRSLTAKGVLDTRGGGGAVIARVGAEHASEAFRLFVQGSQGLVDGITYDQVNDVREAIEIRVARLAATTATGEDIANLVALHEELKRNNDASAQAQLDLDFHRAVAVAAKNPLFLVMMDSIAPVLLEVRRIGAQIPGRKTRGIEAHGKILRRIQERDAAGAEAAMIEHLHDSQAVWRELNKVANPAPIQR